jgi:hypothetical protein
MSLLSWLAVFGFPVLIVVLAVTLNMRSNGTPNSEKR